MDNSQLLVDYLEDLIKKVKEHRILQFEVTVSKVCNPINFDGITFVNDPTGETALKITYVERISL